MPRIFFLIYRQNDFFIFFFSTRSFCVTVKILVPRIKNLAARKKILGIREHFCEWWDFRLFTRKFLLVFTKKFLFLQRSIQYPLLPMWFALSLFPLVSFFSVSLDKGSIRKATLFKPASFQKKGYSVVWVRMSGCMLSSLWRYWSKSNVQYMKWTWNCPLMTTGCQQNLSVVVFLNIQKKIWLNNEL